MQNRREGNKIRKQLEFFLFLFLFFWMRLLRVELGLDTLLIYYYL